MTDDAGAPTMKPFWEISDADVDAALGATTWYPANRGYFRGGGFSSQFVSRGGMPVTMARINLVSGTGPVLQMAEGWTVDLPSDVHDVLDQRTDPTWPTHWFVPRTTGHGPFRDVYTVMANWAANHGAISYGHVGADLISLASMLRIPVHMHNVPEEDVFRPSAWSNLGTVLYAQARAAEMESASAGGGGVFAMFDAPFDSALLQRMMADAAR